MRLAGKVAFITGGAGSIGLATARLFLAEGASVVISDIVAPAESGGAVFVEADVTSSDAVARAVRTCVDEFGGLDIAFANAGVFGSVAPVEDYPEDVFAHVLAVNVLGPFHVAKHALKAMRPGGSLVLNSSVVGLTSDPGIAAYATSKHALVGLMRTAAKEVASRGIRVNTIHPGPVDNAFQHTIEVTATGLEEERAAGVFDGMIPLGRHASADEIARAVLFLACDDSSFLTGATIPVDGGMSA
ncbi:SDR family NAD(P)-dependent oxidoreductase [Solirubrobacter soli]|uniref:SDR family NAD(P)-dependent oxidoreductase n=1 Tax=Solirubrobacter soli TaxID=363832 RepID=UPI00048A315D|nr:SDR family NAD(P)-dependent oxidoreductase [Solirubrobacter soli]